MANRQTSSVDVGCCIQQQRSLGECPTWSRLDSINAEKKLDGCDGPLAVRFGMLAAPEQPYAAWTGLPLLGLLALLTYAGIQATNSDSYNNLVRGSELLLLLAFDIEIGRVDPAAAKVQFLFYAVPHFAVHLT